MIPTGLGIVSGIIFCLVYSYFTGKFPKKIKCCDDGWQPIETFPHDKEIKYYLLSDGFDTFRGSFSPTYNKDGKIVCGYKEALATHWRYLPLPPCSDIKE